MEIFQCSKKPDDFLVLVAVRKEEQHLWGAFLSKGETGTMKAVMESIVRNWRTSKDMARARPNKL